MQLFVVTDRKRKAIYVFNNHDAALRCRLERKLDQWQLTGCVIYDDWRDGEPIRTDGDTTR
jgi:hypothetical protein